MMQVFTRSRNKFQFDVGFLVVLGIAFIAIWPFISRNSLPAETDAELHIFRLHELTLLIQGGELYPRWAPNFYHGYGYPIFNYYAPLSYYLGLIVSLWPPFDAVQGVKFVFVLGLIFGGVGTYGYVRDNWGRSAGFIATAVYLYAPYIQYIDPHARGVLAETLSFGIFPLTLWVYDRLQRTGGRLPFGLSVVLTAALISSHNLMGLLFFGVLTAWTIWHIFFVANLPFPKLPMISLVLGLGAASFFWLPVLLEQDAVNLNTLIGEGDNFDFRTHFLGLRQMFGPTNRLDWGATEPNFRFNLGMAQWLMGGAALLLMFNKRFKSQQRVIFFIIGLFLLIFFMLPLSEFLWQAVPILPFFQFPWRFMGAAAFFLAVISGAGLGEWVEKSAQKSFLAGVLILVPIVFGLPLSQPAPWPNFGEVNSLRMSLIEHEGRWLGTTSTADFVPATVDIVPERNGNVVAGFYDGTPLDRVNRVTLPEGATVTTSEIKPLHFQYKMLTPKNTRLRLFLFEFPGWQVKIDNKLVETELGRPEGLIVIPVPAGEHTIDVQFVTTPLRRLANWISWGALFLTAVMVIWLLPQPQMFQTTWLPVSRMIWGILLGFNLLFLLVLSPSGWLHFDSSDFRAEPAEIKLEVNFGDQIRLIGLDIDGKTAVKPGDDIPITLYWQANTQLDINYQLFVHVISEEGLLISQSDKLNPGDFPTKRWPTDKYVRDEHILSIPEGTPAGTYQVSTGLWVQTEGWRLPVFDENEAQVGDNFELFTIEVR